MAIIQSKLKGCVEERSMESLDKLAGILDAAQEQRPAEMDTNDETETTIVAVDASETVVDQRGENRARGKKTSKRHTNRKHSLKSAVKKETEARPKRRPKYFVQF
jgi:hypothetical protein